jgi:cytoskeletal protein RodZ
MDEQRMLAEIERRLAAENPGLASDLTSFRKPSRVSVLRSTRARVIGSLFTVVVVAMVSLMVYAMLPFRSGGRTVGNHPVTTTSVNGGPDQAKIGAEPVKSAAAKSSAAQAPAGKTSASAQSSAGTATGKSSPSARTSASSAAHSPSTPAVAQSGTGASAAVNGP